VSDSQQVDTNEAQAFETDRFRRGLVSLLMSNFGSNVLGVFSGIFLARILGEGGRGQYQYAAMFYSAVPAFLTLSLGTHIAVATGTPAQVGRLRVWALVFSLAGAAAAPVLIVAGLSSTSVVIVALGSPGFMLSDMVLGLARQQHRYRLISMIRWFDVGGSSLIVVILGITHQLSVETAILSLIATTDLAILVAYVVLRSGQPPTCRPNWGGISQLHGTSLILIFSSWIDQLLLGALAGTGALGIYAVANTVASQLNIVTSVLTMTTFSMAAQGMTVAARLRSANRIIITVVWAGVPFLVFLGPRLAELGFGHAFRSVGPQAAALLFAYALSASLQLIEAQLFLLHQPRRTLLGRLVGLSSLAITAPILALNPNGYTAALMSALLLLPALVYDVWHLPELQRLEWTKWLMPLTPREGRLIVLGFTRREATRLVHASAEIPLEEAPLA